MKLRRIEAINFGGLNDCRLGDLAPGLTLVFGPNESGKSTYAALTRGVLYGYPDGRSADRSYKPEVGPRAARLVFTDGGGEWAIRRTDGAKRGTVDVETLSGDKRPGLLDEIVGGVSEQSFRVVFGFGVDELSLVESGNRDGVVARLYAAGSGLGVNPLDVHQELVARADRLYAPRSRKPVVNTLASDIKDRMDRVRELEAQAAGFTEQVARLAELDALVDDAKSLRARLDAAQRRLELDAQKAAKLEDELDVATARAAEAQAQRAAAAERIAAIEVDEELVAAGPEIDALLSEASAVRQRLQAASEAQARASTIEREAQALPEVPAGIDHGPSTRQRIDEFASSLGAARVNVESTASTARASEAAAEGAAAAAAERQAPASVSPVAIVGWVMLGLGLVAAAAAVVLGQWVGVGVAVVAAVGGLVVSVLSRTVRPATNPDERLEGARAQAAADRALAQAARDEQARVEGEWAAWTHAAGFVGAVSPARVRELLDVAAKGAELESRRRELVGDVQGQLDAVTAWSRRLAALLGQRVDASYLEAQRAPELAARVQSLLEAARQAQTQRDALKEQAATDERSEREARGAAGNARAALDLLARTHDVEADRPSAGLASLVQTSRVELDLAIDEADRLVAEQSALKAQIDDAGRGDELARLRQEIEGLRGRAQIAADDYLVAAMAAELVDRARSAYERDRQPAVIQASSAIFKRMTDGRYTDIRVPLDGSGMRAISASGNARPTERLSRGTAAQLYLSLRLGLVSSLGETGCNLPVLMDDVVVDFDSERRIQAARAIADLATERQVVFFTCHPEVVEVFGEAAPGAATITLDRCSV